MSEAENQNNGNSDVTQQRTNGEDVADAQGSHDSSSSRSTVARMPVERDDEYYNMNHKSRGEAVIFNHDTFEVPDHDLRPRPGTKVDCNNLQQVLETLGFNVTTLNNLTSSEVNSNIHQVSKMNHADHDCLLIFVLSHGEMGMLYAKDTHYKPENLWSEFTADKCPTLAGKPKLFFIQACQGDKLDAGITLARRPETDGFSSSSYRIPVHADFLVVLSTVPGYLSWRNTTYGSWFIQALCEELGCSGTKKDILTLLTSVCRRVALDYESHTPFVPNTNLQKQVPCVYTMLTRLLVFKDKK